MEKFYHVEYLDRVKCHEGKIFTVKRTNIYRYKSGTTSSCLTENVEATSDQDVKIGDTVLCKEERSSKRPRMWKGKILRESSSGSPEVSASDDLAVDPQDLSLSPPPKKRRKELKEGTGKGTGWILYFIT